MSTADTKNQELVKINNSAMQETIAGIMADTLLNTQKKKKTT